MGEKMKSSESLKVTTDEKRELGSFDVVKKNDKEVRFKMRTDKFPGSIEDERRDYNKSKDRNKAITDVFKTWEAEVTKPECSEIVEKAMKNPDNYKSMVEDYIKAAPAADAVPVLEKELREFNGKYDYHYELHEAMAMEKLNYKDTTDLDLNADFKEILEKKIKEFREQMEIAQDLIAYAEKKIEELK